MKQDRVKVVQGTPFVVQLLHGSSGYKQPIVLNVDRGYKHVDLFTVLSKRDCCE